MTGFSNAVRELMRQRASESGFPQCEVMAACQGDRASIFEAHHRRARGMGSSKRPETNLAGNGLIVCPQDHRYIESHRETALRNGWLVRQNQNPAATPVLYRRRWMLLDDAGNVTPAKCVCGEITDSGWYPGPCVCVEEL